MNVIWKECGTGMTYEQCRMGEVLADFILFLHYCFGEFAERYVMVVVVVVVAVADILVLMLL